MSTTSTATGIHAGSIFARVVQHFDAAEHIDTGRDHGGRMEAAGEGEASESDC